MTHEEDFLSAASLRSKISEVIENVEQTRRPTIVTENGKAKAVVLDFDSYRELRQRSTSVLDRSLALARQEGQDPELLARIEVGAVHPAMAAFGLWKDTAELETLAEELDRHRQQGPRRPDPQL